MDNKQRHYFNMARCSALWQRITDHGLDQDIRAKVTAQKHCAGMILDLLRRDYPQVLTEGDDIKLVRTMLSHVGLDIDAIGYNKMPQQWKLQYRYSRDEVSAQCRKGQRKVSANRKLTTDYNPKQGITFWLQQGFSEQEAQARATAHKRRNSPRCTEFYVAKGYTQEEAKNQVAKLASRGAIAALKKTAVPSTEKRVAEALTALKVRFVTQLRLRAPESSKRHVFAFDFFLPDFNLLVEVNGAYWHCDPRFWQATDLINLPGKGPTMASEVWYADSVKARTARDAGYVLLVIWETETKNIEALNRIISNAIQSPQNCTPSP